MSYLDLDVDARGRLIERQRAGGFSPETTAQRARDKLSARERSRRAKDVHRRTAALKAALAAEAGYEPDPVGQAYEVFAAARAAFFAALEKDGAAAANTERLADRMMNARGRFLDVLRARAR